VEGEDESCECECESDCECSEDEDGSASSSVSPSSSLSPHLHHHHHHHHHHHQQHHHHHHHHTGVLLRSSQPLVGLMGQRCEADEGLIRQAVVASGGARSILIVDARPLANAYAQTALGNGYENPDNYVGEGVEQVQLEFLSIENIHAMRKSMKTLKKLCVRLVDSVASQETRAESSQWWSHFANSSHLHHLACIMAGVNCVVSHVSRGVTVLVHCSDGWDRTPQVTSLSELCLDPYYRTLAGFQVLVEKEWLSFGHRFLDRVNHGNMTGDKEASPVFAQFLTQMHNIHIFAHLFFHNSFFTHNIHTASAIASWIV